MQDQRHDLRRAWDDLRVPKIVTPQLSVLDGITEDFSRYLKDNKENIPVSVLKTLNVYLKRLNDLKDEKRTVKISIMVTAEPAQKDVNYQVELHAPQIVMF